MHGGLISVESTLGEGSVFTVTMPKGDIDDAPSKMRTKAWQNGSSVTAYLTDIARVGESPLPLHPDAGQPCVGAILLADDNADMREYITNLLAKNGYAVSAVRDGREAFEAAVRERPDLVLTDVMMPRLNGFGHLSELRADERTKDVPVVMLSARAGEEARIEGLRAGADDYLIKPFGAREHPLDARTQPRTPRKTAGPPRPRRTPDSCEHRSPTRRGGAARGEPKKT
jgi:CheY-like chemotaxis protein